MLARVNSPRFPGEIVSSSMPFNDRLNRDVWT
jgi:hypothetical protein